MGPGIYVRAPSPAPFWLRPIALRPAELPGHQAGASAAATRRAYVARSRLKVGDSEGFTVGWRARRAPPRSPLPPESGRFSVRGRKVDDSGLQWHGAPRVREMTLHLLGQRPLYGRVGVFGVARGFG